MWPVPCKCNLSTNYNVFLCFFLQATLLVLSFDVFFSYTLQFYVVMEILGPNVLRPRVSEEWYPLTEFSIRDHP